jgi:hypothetical protein
MGRPITGNLFAFIGGAFHPIRADAAFVAAVQAHDPSQAVSLLSLVKHSIQSCLTLDVHWLPNRKDPPQVFYFLNQRWSNLYDTSYFLFKLTLASEIFF